MPLDDDRGPARATPDPHQNASRGSNPSNGKRRTLGAVSRGKKASSLAGLKPMPCACAECRFTDACDEAIDTNRPVEIAATGLVLVSDVLVAEAVANGIVIPTNTYRAVRPDGRTVYVFQREAT